MVVFSPVVLQVDVQTGAMTLQGDASLALTAYEVHSPGGSLNASGWLQGNLDAQDVGDAEPPAADYNNNAAVDEADLGVWQSAYGLSGSADADGDGDSDGRDLLHWQGTLGETMAPGSTWETFLATSQQLIEAYLLGNSTFASDRSLGFGYNAAVDARDLTFTYTTDADESQTGIVQYVNTGGSAMAVPEPAAAWLLALAWLAACSLRRG